MSVDKNTSSQRFRQIHILLFWLFYKVEHYDLKGEDDAVDRMGVVLLGLGVHSIILQDSPLQCGQWLERKALHLRVWKEEIRLRIQR